MDQSLQRGDHGPRVAELKSMLAKLNLIECEEDWLGKDIEFDDAVDLAVRTLQQRRGIYVDGVVGPMTSRALREALYSPGSRVLLYQASARMSGDDVVELQRSLQKLGMFSSRLDGIFGPLTEEGVIKFQRARGLRMDGIFGPETFESLSLLGLNMPTGDTLAVYEAEMVRQAGPRLSGKRIVINPSLGGAETGVVVQGPYGPITSESILWDISERLEGRLSALGSLTMCTRPRQSNPAVSERAEVANAFDADLMISLGVDAYPNSLAHGVATFYFGSVDGPTSGTGKELARYVQREIVARTGLGNCHSMARTFESLRLTTMPSIEVILGYVSNEGDVAILTDPQQRDRIAEGIVAAVKRLYLIDDEAPTGSFSFADILAYEHDHPAS